MAAISRGTPVITATGALHHGRKLLSVMMSELFATEMPLPQLPGLLQYACNCTDLWSHVDFARAPKHWLFR